MDALLVYMLRAWLRDTAGAHGWSAALADPPTGRTLAAIHAEPSRPWTVEQIAATAGLSRAAFARRFTALVGEPPLTYLTRWRMTTATRLFRDTDKTLKRRGSLSHERSERPRSEWERTPAIRLTTL